MSDKFIIKIDKAVIIILKGVIFLLPLFFLPWTSEYFEFNKQFLLWLAIPVALFLWLIKQARQKQFKFKANPLNLSALIFLGLTFISSIFSLDRFSSFFGYFGRFSDAWLGLLSLVIFYFLIINAGLADSREKIVGLVKLFFYSAAAAAALSLLAMFGVIRAIIGDSSTVFSSVSFNPASGSLMGLSIFLALMSAAAIGFLAGGIVKKTERYFFSAALVLMIVVIALINSNSAKIILGFALPREAVMDYKQSLGVSWSVLKTNPAWGSGPGTFAYDYSLYRPASANASALWQIRFDKSGSHFLELLAAAGLPAGLSYLLIISLVIYLNIKLIIKYFNKGAGVAGADRGLAAVLFMAVVLSFASQIFFPATTVLNFTFWFFLSLLMAYWHTTVPALFKEKIIDFGHWTSRLAWPAVFLAGALWLALAAFEVKFFVADIVAASGVNREASLVTAGKLNPSRYNYGVSLAKLYLNRLRIEAFKPAVARDNNFLNSNLALTVTAARQAADKAPDSVLAWETLGMIYRDVRPLTSGSEPWAVKSFSQALTLEPTNPALAAELAKAYANDNDLASAEKYFIKSLELKPDYYDAKFGLAKTYLQGKKDGLGFKLLSELSGQVSDPEIYYELARFYYNHGEIDKAIGRFNVALSLSPNHSNSLYSLGIAYDAKGDAKQALKYYEKVLELNPGNEEVIKKIKNLK